MRSLLLGLLCLYLSACTAPKMPQLAPQHEPELSSLPPGIATDWLSLKEQTDRLEALRLTQALYLFQECAEWALTLRAETWAFLERVESRQQGLHATDLHTLKEGSQAFLDLRDLMALLIHDYAPWVFQDQALRPGLSQHTILKGQLLALSASLLLYDNVTLSIQAVQSHKLLRRLSNQADIGYGIEADQLEAVMKDYHDPGYRQSLRKAWELISSQPETLEELCAKDLQSAWMWALIEQSPSMQFTRQQSSVRDYAQSLGLLSDQMSDRWKDWGQGSFGRLSQAFGNGIGLVQSRQGKLWQSAELLKDLKGQLKPGDILLEKTPFRLSDYLIPGHFGHVALWIGREDELKALELWDHPLVQPHHRAIKQGHHIVEALRHGVVLNSLERFSNVDDLAVLRFQPDADINLGENILQAFRQLGKAYDFNFDVQSTDRIVCSELIYQVFPEIIWQVDERLGRFVISPDNVALEAIHDHPLELLVFWQDGEKISDFDEAKTLFRKLVRP